MSAERESHMGAHQINHPSDILENAFSRRLQVATESYLVGNRFSFDHRVKDRSVTHFTRVTKAGGEVVLVQAKKYILRATDCSVDLETTRCEPVTDGETACRDLWKSLHQADKEVCILFPSSRSWDLYLYSELMPYGDLSHRYHDTGKQDLTTQDGQRWVQNLSQYSGYSFERVHGSVIYYSEYRSIGD